MHGDFSNITFDPRKHFSRVLIQQGRMWLDADANEQADIFLHYLRSLATDLIGPHAAAGRSFHVHRVNRRNPERLEVTRGHYYVNGILCESEHEVEITVPIAIDRGSGLSYPYLVYLDVWERYVAPEEDPSILEVALGGADTAGRSRITWRIRTHPLERSEPTCEEVEAEWRSYVREWQHEDRGRLRARAAPRGHHDEGSAEDRAGTYTGDENQLIRVEVHAGGLSRSMRSEASPSRYEGATFKWARYNASLAFRILGVDEDAGDDDERDEGAAGGELTFTVERVGRDDDTGLAEGDLVELGYADHPLVYSDPPPPLLRVEAVDPVQRTVSVKGDLSGHQPKRAVLMRRWDRTLEELEHGELESAPDGTIYIPDDDRDDEDVWITLVEGVQIQFKSDDARFHSGDYWLIPTRVATREVRWPRRGSREPESRPPRGVDHHYAPLAIVRAEGDPLDCRRTFAPLARRPGSGSAARSEEEHAVAESAQTEKTVQAATATVNWDVEVADGPHSGEPYRLRSVTTIGRALDAHVCLWRDPMVSQKHAEIYVFDDIVQIEDVGSSNGTFLNGNRITGRRRVQVGDTLLLGESSLVLKEHQE